jgi:hypothetical protein
VGAGSQTIYLHVSKCKNAKIKNFKGNLKRRKGLFWLMILEVSVHGHLDPSLWAVVRQTSWWSKAAPSWQPGSKERGNTGGSMPLKGTFPMTSLLSCRPLFLKILPPPSTTTGW